MRFTDEMIAEDEKRWHARDVVTELGYCGEYMRDRKDMTNDDIRFYAYIMRKACRMLKEHKTIVRCKDCKYWNAGKCLNDNVYWQIEDCGGCYPDFITDSNWFCAEGERR